MMASIALLLSGSFLLGYEKSINALITLFNKEERKEFVFAIATKELFLKVRIYFMILLVCNFGISLYLWNKLEYLLISLNDTLRSLFKDCIAFYCSMTKTERLLAVIILVSLIWHRLYLMFNLPVNSDEIWMFQSFGKNNPLLSFFWYPLPSNHVLQTFVSRIFLYFSPYSLVSMRFPVVLAGIVTYILYCVIADTFLNNKRHTLLSAVIFAASAGVNTSLVYARGYAFTMIFTLLLIYFILKIFREGKSSPGDYAMIYFSIVMGFVSVFSFAYNFVTVVGFFIIYLILKGRVQDAGKLIAFSILSIVTVLVIYGPIFIVNGWDAVFIPPHTNEYLNTVLKDHIRVKIIDWFIGVHDAAPVIISALAVLPVILWFVKKDEVSRLILSLTIFSMLIPWVIMFGHQVYPFGRMLNFIWIFIAIEGGILFSLIKTKMNEKFFSFSLLVALIMVFGLNEISLKNGVFGKHLKTGHHSEKIAEKLLAENRRNVYFENSEYSMMAEYLYAKSGIPISFAYSKNEAVDAVVINRASTPAPWILDKFKLKYQDEDVCIYVP
ncbi:hypothetical protein CHU_1328 [Sporocytophaga myxococcoides]|uniref:Glycosyltransferase RgtA/B/C/D-like domain-containing protein n=2 Tax=Sporocytophaga myxococcoides TaxID=153721 RepID=A0A098LJN2_9BACT|nr:hypothetical protein CHU_1328 [Sporocytophaga myxococcoides]